MIYSTCIRRSAPRPITMTTAATKRKTLPYRRQGEIDYDALDFDPSEPVEKPEAMEQRGLQFDLLRLIWGGLAEFGRHPGVFISWDTIISYDPKDLNVRVSPDLYLSLDVDVDAILERRIYLPWEVGKPLDWALEIASVSTGRIDVTRKRDIYATVGVPEYWRFDPTGGDYHGEPLAGDVLQDGEDRPVALTTAPDGILKGYSPLLDLSLAWDEGRPRFYNPRTGSYVEDFDEVWDARLLAEHRADEERDARIAAESQASEERAARIAAESELERLKKKVKELEHDN